MPTHPRRNREIHAHLRAERIANVGTAENPPWAVRQFAVDRTSRRVAACFAAMADGPRIAGYYTLASASLLLADLPAGAGKKLPRYPTVPPARRLPPSP